MNLRKGLIGVALAASMAAGAAGIASPAFASEGDGVISFGEFVVYRDCSIFSPFYDFATDHTNYSGIYFINDFRLVDNDASIVANYSIVNSVNAFAGLSYTGPKLVLLPLQSFSLCETATAFNNQISSHHF